MQRDGLVEENHALQLEEASLRDPQRIDGLARQIGLQSPQAGQVIRMDSALPDAVTPVMASMAPVAVISCARVFGGRVADPSGPSEARQLLPIWRSASDRQAAMFV